MILVAVFAGTAYADFGEQLDGVLAPPDAAFIAAPPPELTRDIPEDRMQERVAMFDAALAKAKHPQVRAQLLLMRADLWGARAIAERIASLDSLDYTHDIAASKAMKRALADYDELTHTKLPGWHAMDRALAHYGFLLSFDRRPPSLSVMQRLVDEFPSSPHAAYAHIVLGDATIGSEALAHYEAVKAPARVRVYALYRMGSILMDRDVKRAFSVLTDALRLDDDSLIAWELRRGAVKAFARFGAPADAFDAFSPSEPTHALDMLHELASRWNNEGRTKDALATFSELVRRAPDDPRACSWQASALSIVYHLKDNALYFTHAERLVRIFERGKRLREDEDCEVAVKEFTVGVSRDPGTNKALARQLYDLVLHALPDRAMR